MRMFFSISCAVHSIYQADRRSLFIIIIIILSALMMMMIIIISADHISSSLMMMMIINAEHIYQPGHSQFNFFIRTKTSLRS